MRGKLAKELRKLATGIDVKGNEVLDKSVYKKFKRTRNTGQNPKLPKTRWSRGKQRHGIMNTQGDHFPKFHPLRQIGNFFVDLDILGKKSAIHLAKIAGTLPKFELQRKVNELRTRSERIGREAAGG